MNEEFRDGQQFSVMLRKEREKVETEEDSRQGKYWYAKGDAFDRVGKNLFDFLMDLATRHYKDKVKYPLELEAIKGLFYIDKGEYGFFLYFTLLYKDLRKDLDEIKQLLKDRNNNSNNTDNECKSWNTYSNNS